MKSIILFCCLCCILACKKDNGKRDYWGEVSVLKNGASWSGEIVGLQHVFSSEKVDITIENFTEGGRHLDNLLFFKVPKKSGRYKLSYSINQPPDDSLVGARYFNSYEDVLNDIYDLTDNDSTSYLEITEYNGRKDEFRGKFHLTLYRTLAGSINEPDTLIFTEGTFHTRIDN